MRPSITVAQGSDRWRGLTFTDAFDPARKAQIRDFVRQADNFLGFLNTAASLEGTEREPTASPSRSHSRSSPACSQAGPAITGVGASSREASPYV